MWPVLSPVQEEAVGELLSGSSMLQSGTDTMLPAHSPWPEHAVQGLGHDVGVGGKFREHHCLLHGSCNEWALHLTWKARVSQMGVMCEFL